jgi:hypothetical protein
MPIAIDFPSQVRALGRIRALSRPLTLLISIALGLSVVIPMAEVVVILFFHQFGSPRALVSFNEWGIGLSIGNINLQSGALIPLESLGFAQRLTAAGLAALCATCVGIALIHLRGLFVLYSRGTVFAADNIVRMKKFGLWLVVTGIVVNVSGRLFVQVMGTPVQGTANAAMAVVYGAMIYVIAYVMELGREADLERKEFL